MQPDKQETRSLARGGITGSIAAVTSALALMLRSKSEAPTALSAQNAVSHWVWGDKAKHQHRTSLRYTLVGYGIHHASAVFWGVIYEHYFASKPLPPGREVLRATAFTALANFVDYRLTPYRLKPGYEHHLSKKSLALVYGAFALGLAAGHLLQRPRSGVRGTEPSKS